MPLEVSLLVQKRETCKIKYMYTLSSTHSTDPEFQLVKDGGNRVSIQLQIHPTNPEIQSYHNKILIIILLDLI